MNPVLHRLYVGLFFVIGISVTILLAVYGYDYYSLPLEERFFSEKHNLLKPSGLIGQGIGILGSLMMIIGVSVYMLRKRFRPLFNFGYLKNWLELHIFLCSVGPILVLYHTAFKFGGIVSVSFWSMVAVVLSGVVGRFIYVQIPRTIQGKEIDINELNETLENENNKLINYLNVLTSINERIKNACDVAKYKTVTLKGSLIFIVKDFFEMNKILKEIKKDLNNYNYSENEKKEILISVKKKIILSRKVGMLRSMQKLFHFWHIFHLPFAITMFVIMVVHIAVTIAFGYRWIF